ncbi:hypothetical protein TA3x_002379 [Tundrisphaera sp. TA3]|uniref:hypothetical protein n=1 Tax=Tundrisphaera sp. TA3 TaxID=3435775 RepID=UPI003EBB90D4
MRRIGGGKSNRTGDDPGSSGRAIRLALALGLIGPAGVRAGDEGPMLSAPAGLPDAAPLPGPADAPPIRQGPVLALPGISTPPRGAAPAPAADLMLPDLDAPIGMSNAPAPARAAEPTIIETMPFEPAAPIDERPTTPRSSARATPTASTSGPTRSATPPPPARRPWWFGNARPGTAPTPASAPGRAAVASGGSMANPSEPKNDPAADTLLRRKIERQARALVGNRARSLEVRVVGKQVAIEARGVGIFQKRAVRRSLESMPSLSGLRSSVVVLD